jgi:hypothetical protein
MPVLGAALAGVHRLASSIGNRSTPRFDSSHGRRLAILTAEPEEQ